MAIGKEGDNNNNQSDRVSLLLAGRAGISRVVVVVLLVAWLPVDWQSVNSGQPAARAAAVVCFDWAPPISMSRAPRWDLHTYAPLPLATATINGPGSRFTWPLV